MSLHFSICPFRSNSAAVIDLRIWPVAALLVIGLSISLSASKANGQPGPLANGPPPPNQPFGLGAPHGGDQGVNNVGPGAQGGGTQADFDSLIELITNTIDPDSWEEVGGVGAINGFEGGVYVDAAGLLRQVPPEVSQRLQALQRTASAQSPPNRNDVKKETSLRKISLQRLEEHVRRLAEQDARPNDVMRHLAGLTAITSVHLLKDTNEIVIAGPAGDWHPGPQGQAVHVISGQPTLLLDDLVVMLRNAVNEQGRFGCSITPRQGNLADTQAFLHESATNPLKPGRRTAWLDDIRRRMGRQDIELYGLPSNCGAARALVEADYHMKLIGMGLAEGVEGVTSYLDSVEPDANGQIPPLSVLRWWFTLNYDKLTRSAAGDVFQWSGSSVKVLSENELLSLQGQRIHTGQSDDLNHQFAASFTKHFPELCRKYPIYARLKNLFDLALATTIIQSEDWPGRTDWPMPYFGESTDNSAAVYRPWTASVPLEVETVLNHRVIGRRYIVAGVSGGVSVHAAEAAEQLVSTAEADATLERVSAADRGEFGDASDRWWWD